MRLAQFIPAPVKEMVKDGMRYRTIRKILKSLRATGTLTFEEIHAFHLAWHSTGGFPADCAYIRELLRLCVSGPVLELGTGGTTLLMNEIAQQKGFKVYSLEQDSDWAVKVMEWGPRAVNVIDAPLRSYSGYQWYAVGDYLPQHFPLIVCDGPYIDESVGEPAYSAWRYGLLPWLRASHTTWEVILFDDVNDSRGNALLDRWVKEFGVKVERMKSTYGELAVIRP